MDGSAKHQTLQPLVFPSCFKPAANHNDGGPLTTMKQSQSTEVIVLTQA